LVFEIVIFAIQTLILYVITMNSSILKVMSLPMLLWMSLHTVSSCSFNNSASIEAVADTIAIDTLENVVLQRSEVAYSEMNDKSHCFIVVSKQELMLYVCEALDDDTVRLAEYPVCMGKNKGHKQKKGDMRTPECSWEQPFMISQIQDASTWSHDFGDGRGSILAYGNWFMRLVTPGFSGIGIHGSTNNEDSVPGRASEGCIRLLNDDLDVLKAKYAYEGMKVVVKAEGEGLKPFEMKYYL